MAAGVPGCWLLLHTGQQTTAERSRADKGAAPGAGVSGGLLFCSMWSELASLQVPQEMSSQVHCVLIKCMWVFECVAFGGTWKRGRVLIWLRVGETRASPLDTRTGPADIPGGLSVSHPCLAWPALLPVARIL